MPGMQIIFHCALVANIYLFKVIKRNASKTFEICLKLTIKTLDWRQSCRSCNDISHVILVLLLLTLNIFHTSFYCFYGFYFSSVSIYFWLFCYWLKILSYNTKNTSLISAISWEEISALLRHQIFSLGWRF